MTRWLFLLAGPILWAIHFSAAYAIASASLQASGGMNTTARLVFGAISIVLALAAIGLAIPKGAGSAFGRFTSTIRRTGCVLAAVAIVWQTLPLLLR